MAKKKKSGSKKNVSKKNVTLEKAENVKETEVSLEKDTAENVQKASEKKTSEKKASEKKAADKKAEKKPSVFARIAKYFRECRSEIKKIVWPTPKATFKNVGIVLSVLVVVGLFVYALDTGFLALLKLIIDV